MAELWFRFKSSEDSLPVQLSKPRVCRCLLTQQSVCIKFHVSQGCNDQAKHHRMAVSQGSFIHFFILHSTEKCPDINQSSPIKESMDANNFVNICLNYLIYYPIELMYNFSEWIETIHPYTIYMTQVNTKQNKRTLRFLIYVRVFEFDTRQF